MIWILLLVGVGAMAAWLVWPRRLQTLENIPAVIDRDFQAHDIVETTEDPREVRPMAEAAARIISQQPDRRQAGEPASRTRRKRPAEPPEPRH